MATPANYPEEKCFNVYWKIKNFSYCFEQIRSPKFSVYGREYCLDLRPEHVNVICRLSQEYRSSPTVEISFLTCDGSPEESISGDKDDALRVPKDVIFGNRRNAFLPEDTLTVRLRYLTPLDRGKLFIFSRIGFKQKYFLWTFECNDDNPWRCIKSAEKSTLYGDINLGLKPAGGNSDEQFNVRISRTGGEGCYYVFKISVLDVDGKVLNEVSDEFFFQKQDGSQVRGFPSIIKKNKWIGYKNLLLSDNKLSLKCYLSMSQGTVTDETTVMSYCENANPLVKESEELSMIFKEKNNYRSVTELQTDMKSILENETLFDVGLHIGSEVIKAHKSILSARSPVFKTMFTKDMMEAIYNTVVIEDFDVETVRRFLLYMYTDFIHDDEWESMKRLYIAADKYEVPSLKDKCASFLKTNLSVSNVCEALLLADLHQDANLKAAVLDFTSEYDSAVFASEAWKELEKNKSSLAFQVLREICCNKRFR